MYYHCVPYNLHYMYWHLFTFVCLIKDATHSCIRKCSHIILQLFSPERTCELSKDTRKQTLFFNNSTLFFFYLTSLRITFMKQDYRRLCIFQFPNVLSGR